MSQKIITRFAPSPTGFLHVGGIRTALYAWLLAKKDNGTFILRIEDTDKKREVEGAPSHIMEALNWIGIDWDEGPDIGGENEPYYQSERLDIYIKYAKKLIAQGMAYPDPYSEEELNEMREKAELDGKPFLYREYRPEKFEEWDEKKPLRFKVPEIKSYKWHDIVFGDLSAGPEALDDFILIKSDGYPTYNFCHIVDDIEMGITHVTRGIEFISSVPKFLSLYEALNENPPVFITLPPIMGPDGNKKLSKRDGAKDALDYKNEGYLPEAMMNYLALLGWHPKDNREIFTKDELLEVFDVNRIQKAGAQWDENKLDWVNKEHIKILSPEELEINIFQWLPQELRIPALVPLIAERIFKFSDIKKMLAEGELDIFLNSPEYSKEKLVYKNVSMDKILTNIKFAIKALEEIDEVDFSKEKIKEVLMKKADGLDSRGELLHPIRFALSGRDQSPDPFVIAEILGKHETLSRLQKAL